MQNRAKGLKYVNEVKKILSKEWGHLVDGPYSRTVFFGGHAQAVHTDLFHVFDLVSYNPDARQYSMHQVTVLDKKASKVQAIQKAGLTGYVWCRCKIKKKVYWRLFFVPPFRETEIPVEAP